MVALIKDRNTPRAAGDAYSYPVKAATTIYAGALVAIDAAGLAVPGAAVAAQVTAGRADARTVNAGANGAEKVSVRRGVFRFENSAAADAITLADYGKSAFVVDDQTVAKTNGAGARPVAGIIRDVDAQGVWVEI